MFVFWCEACVFASSVFVFPFEGVWSVSLSFLACLCFPMRLFWSVSLSSSVFVLSF